MEAAANSAGRAKGHADAALAARDEARNAKNEADRAAEKAKLDGLAVEHALQRVRVLVADAEHQVKLAIEARENLLAERARGLLAQLKRGLENAFNPMITEPSRRMEVVEFDTATFLRDLFPELMTSIENRRHERWEVVERPSPVILHHGLAGPRELVSPIFEIKVRYRNPAKGDYKDDCFRIAYSRDEHFGVLRNREFVECVSADARIDEWRKRHIYRPVWDRK
jgi:hypothetical protein